MSNNFKHLSRQEIKNTLQKWREENVRSPEKVKQLWQELTMNSLGDDKWIILEQVCLAALDLYDGYLIKECLLELDSKFPNSNRVKILKIMAKLEMRERYDEAIKLYDTMIQEDETNSLPYKRKIAILIAQEKTREAINSLNEYLKKFLNDTEAWSELCDLYIQKQEYVKAAFCMEELILTNPHIYVYYLKYAEIQYTIGTNESIELAKSYFTQAYKLNPDCLRALYGILESSSYFFNSPAKRKENIKIYENAVSKIMQLYQDKNGFSIDKDKLNIFIWQDKLLK